MQCEQFETRLHNVLDRRQSPACDVELSNHAAICSQCASVLQAESVMTEILSTEPQSFNGHSRAPDVIMLARAVDRSIESPKTHSPTSGASRRVWLALATAVTLAIWVVPFWFGSPTEPTDSQGQPSQQVTSSHGSDQPNPSKNDFASRFDSQATHQLTLFAGKKLQGADRVAVTMAGDLSPWARSIGSAFDALRRAVPGRKGTRLNTSEQSRQVRPSTDSIVD